MIPPQQTGLRWIKACHATAQCVEVAAQGDLVVVRDSKNPAVELRYTRQEFAVFLDGAKRGVFDRLDD